MPWFDAYASTHVWPNHVEQLTTRLVIWSANTYCGTHCAALEARQPWFLSICDRSQSVVDLLQSSKSNWMFFLKRNVSVKNWQFLGSFWWKSYARFLTGKFPDYRRAARGCSKKSPDQKSLDWSGVNWSRAKDFRLIEDENPPERATVRLISQIKNRDLFSA